MPTFNIITLKGAKGAIELEESQTVGDLYTAVQQVVGWTDAEDDYYVLIVSGKKLIDLTVALNTALPNINSPKIQVIVTKLSKPLSKSKALSATSTSNPEPTQPTMTDTIASTPLSPAAATVETIKPVATPIPTPAITVTQTSPTPTTHTSTIAQTPLTTPIISTPVSVAHTTPTTPATSTNDIDFENFPKDLDFLPLLFNRDNFESFMENLSYVNPDVAAEIEKNPHTFMMAVETFTRAAHNPDFNPKTHVTAIDQQFTQAQSRGGAVGGGAVGGGAAVAAAGAPAARPAPRQRVQQSDAMAAQLSDAEKAKVQQLVELGFSYNKALQAFIICDKNEEYAANYLFEHME